MNPKIIAVTIFVICGSSAVVESSVLGNAASTGRIVHGLCHNDANRKSQPVIDAFFACYDDVPGKELFVQCQNQVFGGTMSTVANVDSTCGQPLKLPVYAACLGRGFRGADLDMDSSVERLNACQSKVLGVGGEDMATQIKPSV